MSALTRMVHTAARQAQAAAANGPPVPLEEQWEYECYWLAMVGLRDALNILGKDRWELAAFHAPINDKHQIGATMKRRKAPSRRIIAP